MLVVLAVFLAQGCVTRTGHIKSVVQSGPVPGKWNDALTDKYTKTCGERGLKFIEDYNEKYPVGAPEYSGVRLAADIESLLAKQLDEEVAWREDRIEAAEARRAQLLVQRTATAGDAKAQKRIAASLVETDKEIAVLRKEIHEARAKYFAERGRHLGEERTTLMALAEEVEKMDAAAEARDRDAVQVAIDEARKLALSNKNAHALLEVMRIERNKIIGELMLIARRVHDEKNNYLHYGRAGANILLDTTQLGATAAGTVTGSESTARALSAFATFVKGGQESVDKRVFYEHATAVIVRIVNAQRLEQERILRLKMAESVVDYPLEVAVSDFAAFLTAGGLPDALAELGLEAKEKELKALDSLKELQVLGAEAVKRREAEAARRAAEREKRRANIEAILQPYLAGTPFAP
ncbi:MAG: hypothetical protein KF886_02765 [Candidatus Hydrogenedentes bacterium]|nr:hypothetical protein [Candidatus Hydrogenedentota bacterium]